jgi:para-nitrobenzyl esterase
MVIINTKKGKVKGVQESDYQRFYGIPYAKPPIGNLRFLEPQPNDPWNDIKDASSFKAIPPQNYVDDPPIGQEESEDCLFLNIWTPQADDKRRPVMFWIHGGGFVIGAGSRKRLNGSKLASYGDVVVVTFNYRLGALGFLNLPNVTPNIGILDQITALKWVNDNIESFGGDPQNITIFGESAGGMSVGILLTISSATGLYQKAIIESGATNPISFEPTSARQGAEKFVKKLGLKNAEIADLQSVPLDKLMKVQKKIAGTVFDLTSNPFRPFVDGAVMTEQPIEIIRKGNSANVPIIIGYNSEELGMIANLLEDSGEVKRKLIMKVIKSQLKKSGISKEDLDGLIEIYNREIKKKYHGKEFKYWDFILSDSMFRIPILRQIEAHLENESNIYHYMFHYNSPKFGAALHTFEIAFVFGTLGEDMVKDAVVNSKDTTELSNLMMKTWVNFARNGNPNHKGIPKWKPYELKNRTTMFLSDKPKSINDPDEVLRKAWDDII